ncbi:SRRM2 protein homolog rsr-2-like [Malaclemys terrapin pileata]|uniref:SRRM2 protein homolog rsr-2-like n=1 Tax=Malaclemys terrapin pileata TaxID=2991368 RepID=UPI0023A865E0|nr:SRRM2 protein homolog rsr-2-like [Malaclemys terrapin pileata]XP_053901404.1 SRRM2 protein homolog rsr-2-like [Malaclemys terrapin pileata]
MQADNQKRAPAWTVREVLDLIAVWGEDSVLAELRSKRRNAKTFEKISKGMMERGHNRDSEQCRVKVKELRQAYQKTKEANGRSGSEPQTCRYYAELHAILGGAATTTPPLFVDSGSGIVSTPEDSANGVEEEEEEEDELAESTQHSILPNSQDLFITLTEVPSQASQASTQDSDPMEGTSAAANSSSLPPPSRRLSQIRRRKKKTREDMFSEIMQSNRSDRAHLNEWKETVSKYRKEVSEREERRDQREERRDQREERRDDRDERWRQEDQRMKDAMLGLLRRLVEVQEQLLENRLPLQPLFPPPPSPCSVSSSPRRVRTRGGRLRTPSHSTPVDSPSKRLSFF